MKINRIIRYSSLLSLAVLLFIFSAFSVFAVDKPQNVGEGKLRGCQARESAIKTRMSHLTQLATNMLTKFDKHAKKVEDYYTTKVVPSGKTVSNYDTLVADIQTKKIAVDAALAKAKTDTDAFSCLGGAPKAQMTQFRTDMQAVKKALKEYRTSIKDLIVAVHSVTGKITPKPTGS